MGGSGSGVCRGRRSLAGDPASADSGMMHKLAPFGLFEPSGKNNSLKKRTSLRRSAVRRIFTLGMFGESATNGTRANDFAGAWSRQRANFAG